MWAGSARSLVKPNHVGDTVGAGMSSDWSFRRRGDTIVRRPFTVIMMTAGDDDEVEEATKTVESTWNMPGLRKEVQRLLLRCHKKVGKANLRVSKAREEVDRLTADDSTTLEDLENCPNLDALELELSELKTRLQGLNSLEESLQKIKNKSAVLPEDVASLAIDLGVDDKPRKLPPRGPGKKKGPREQTSSRLPYRRYYSFDNVEIRVGKKAQDNEELSLSPKHRDGADWWMQ